STSRPSGRFHREVVRERLLQEKIEQLTQRLVLWMPEVRLETGKIVELDHGRERKVLRHQLLVLGAMFQAGADVKAPHGRNPGRGSLKGTEHRLPVCGRDVRLGT